MKASSNFVKRGLNVSSFRVNLKKVIDESYDIEIGYDLSGKLQIWQDL